MFSSEIFIADCVNFLYRNNYYTYDEAKEDINLYIRFNLPTDFKDQGIIDYLTGMILVNYIELEYKNNPQVFINVNVDNDIDNEDIDIWLAAAEFAV